ncbi:MAG: hypothetical protein ACKVPJ_13655 [Chitinophagales bacterium]
MYSPVFPYYLINTEATVAIKVTNEKYLEKVVCKEVLTAKSDLIERECKIIQNTYSKEDILKMNGMKESNAVEYLTLLYKCMAYMHEKYLSILCENMEFNEKKN